MDLATPVPDELRDAIRCCTENPQVETWPRDAWIATLSHHGAPTTWAETLRGSVGRKDIARAVAAHRRDGQVLDAFLTVMAWGHGPSGYGPSRVMRIDGVVNPAYRGSLERRLTTGAEVAAKAGPVEAFRHFTSKDGRINWFGPAFFTKWLYFTTAGGDPYTAAALPILDARVERWLCEVGDVSVRACPRGYGRYVRLLRLWADALGATPARIEEAIFTLDQGRHR